MAFRTSGNSDTAQLLLWLQEIPQKPSELFPSFMRVMYSSRLVWLSPLFEDQKRTNLLSSSCLFFSSIINIVIIHIVLIIANSIFNIIN